MGWPDAIVPVVIMMSVDPVFARAVAKTRATDIRERGTMHATGGGRFVIFRDRIIAISGPLEGARLDAHPPLMAWTQRGQHVITAGLKRDRWEADQTEMGTYYTDVDRKVVVGFPDACTRLKLRQLGNPTVMRVGSRPGAEPQETFEPLEEKPAIVPTAILPPPVIARVAPEPLTLDGLPARQSKQLPAIVGTPSGFIWVTTIDQLNPLAVPPVRHTVPISSSAMLVCAGLGLVIARRRFFHVKEL